MHAPGYLREAFGDYLDSDCEADVVLVDDEEWPVAKLCGKLWRCTDVLPGAYCGDLDIPQGSTYAQAVRVVLTQIRRRAAQAESSSESAGRVDDTPSGAAHRGELRQLMLPFSD